ncbi:MAG: hypothetical protein WBK88_05795, partial [Methanothrix sp.]
MRHLFILLALFILAGPAASTTEVRVGEAAAPTGAVILVVDGMGAAYVYPELEPLAADGTPLASAILFNLTAKGARVLDDSVPVP